jgi:hypothetical protein
MKDCDVIPLIVDLIGSFYNSSLNALTRARTAASVNTSRHITGLSIFYNFSEAQATLETVIFSFLTVEATINYIFFNEQESKQNQSGIDRWLKNKWKSSLSISDKFVLLFNKYSSTDLDKFQNVTSLFYEFVSFRNHIVHSYPEKYDALVDFSDIPGGVFVHAVESCTTHKLFPYSGFTEEIARIALQDAARCYEIMLIVLALIDAQFIAALKLPYCDATNKIVLKHLPPAKIIETLEPRYYPKIDPRTFS